MGRYKTILSITFTILVVCIFVSEEGSMRYAPPIATETLRIVVIVFCSSYSLGIVGVVIIISSGVQYCLVHDGVQLFRGPIPVKAHVGILTP